MTLTGVRGVMEPVRNAEIRRAHNLARLVLSDGTPLVWMLWRGGFKFAACDGRSKAALSRAPKRAAQLRRAAPALSSSASSTS